MKADRLRSSATAGLSSQRWIRADHIILIAISFN